MNCIDLYSGIGGWTLGMKLNGIDHLKSYEWNKESNQTHNINFGTYTDEIDIRKLDFSRDLPEQGTVDFIVGSPPCTQFSYSNKGGGGDIEDGLVDMYQFLSVVEYMKPKYWAMENVPRVKGILERVLIEDPKFKRFKKLFNYLEVVDASDYGTPQRRRRMIAGNFPFQLFEAYKFKTGRRTLGEILNSLKKEVIIDPIYGISIAKSKITDHIKEDSLNIEELRLNKEAKSYHPVYNGMSFPEVEDKPARTITSTCTRVSRESLVIQNGIGFRRLTVRERAMLMGFPISYQFYGKTYNSKLKMIGNSIPPVLTFYLFQSMLERPLKDLQLINEVETYIHKSPEVEIPHTPPDIVKFKYRDVRSFRLAIPEYRFGSGVRFELSNKVNKEECNWSVKFFYGSSKRIRQVLFTKKNHSQILKLLELQNINIKENIEKLIAFSSNLSSKELQKKWSHRNQDYTHPFEVLDMISKLSLEINEKISHLKISDSEFISVVGENLNSKLLDNKSLVISGIISGYLFNNYLKA